MLEQVNNFWFFDPTAALAAVPVAATAPTIAVAENYDQEV
jgi:hypothetical protein